MIKIGQLVKVLDAPMGVPNHVIGNVYKVEYIDDDNDDLPIGLEVPNAKGHLNCWWFKKTQIEPVGTRIYITDDDRFHLLEAAVLIKGITAATRTESDFADIIELLERLGGR